MYLVSKTQTFAKLFFLVTFTGLLFYLTIAFYSVNAAFRTMSEVNRIQKQSNVFPSIIDGKFNKDLKYILLWLNHDKENYLGEGQIPFLINKCANINCYVTTNRELLNGDYNNFDAIVFKDIHIQWWDNKTMPTSRSPHQKYVFYSMRSSSDYPMCNIHNDNYFNWTWSYKLHSDILTPFIQVRDMNSNIVAPKHDVQWLEDMIYLSNEDIMRMQSKTKAVAWIANECPNESRRTIFVKRLRNALKEFKLDLDIFGDCEKRPCPGNTTEGCYRTIEKDYFYYLSLEKTFAEDYVSNEVLTALNHDAVPIVLGGADYTKFLPDGSYFNARFDTEEKLASQIYYFIRNPQLYFSYFRWRNHYSFRESKNTGICELCALLNDPVRVKHRSSYQHFRKWWYTYNLLDVCFPKGAESFDVVLSYLHKNTKASTVNENHKLRKA